MSKPNVLDCGYELKSTPMRIIFEPKLFTSGSQPEYLENTTRLRPDTPIETPLMNLFFLIGIL